jgi:hypothetical protein
LAGGGGQSTREKPEGRSLSATWGEAVSHGYPATGISLLLMRCA